MKFKKIASRIFLLFMGGVIGIFLPVIPVNSIKLGDPLTPYDKRITVEILQTDLEEILRIVRHGRLNSVYEILYYQTQAPLLNIHKSMPTYRVSPKPMKEIPPLGSIKVKTGTICGVLCGAGINYSLKKQDGKWIVIYRGNWIS